MSIRTLGMKLIYFHSRKCIWKCHLRNGCIFFSGSMCQNQHSVCWWHWAIDARTSIRIVMSKIASCIYLGRALNSQYDVDLPNICSERTVFIAIPWNMKFAYSPQQSLNKIVRLRQYIVTDVLCHWLASSQKLMQSYLNLWSIIWLTGIKMY